MKHIIFSILLGLVVSACSTKTLKSYEEGDLVSRSEIKTEYVNSEYDFKLIKIKIDDVPHLQVVIKKTDNYAEISEKIYEKIGVYIVQKDNLLSDSSSLSSVRENTGETISKQVSENFQKSGNLPEKSRVILFVNNTELTGYSEGSSVYFPLKNLKIDFKNHNDHLASIKIGEKTFSISKELDGLIAEEYKSSHPEKFYKGRQYLENKYKMSFCNSPDVYYSIASGGAKFQKNCIYLLKRIFKVLQSTSKGSLLQALGLPIEVPQQTLFLKTSERFVDEDRIDDLLAEYIGPTSYVTVMGAEKTVHSFRYLGRVNMIYSNSGDTSSLADEQE